MVQSPYNNFKGLVEARVSGTCGAEVPVETERVKPRFTVNGHEVTRAQAERIMLGKCSLK